MRGRGGMGLMKARAAGAAGAAATSFLAVKDAMVSGFPSAALVVGAATVIHTGSGNPTNGNVEAHVIEGGIIRTSPIWEQQGPEDHTVGGLLKTAAGRLTFIQLAHSDGSGFNQMTTVNPVTSAVAAQVDYKNIARDIPIGSPATYPTASYGQAFGPFSNDEVLVFQRLNGSSLSAQRFVRTTSAAIDAEASGGASPTWTETILYTTPAATRNYPVVKRSTGTPDKNHVGHFFGDGNLRPLRYSYVKLNAGNWTHYAGNDTPVTMGADLETVLTSGNGSIVDATANTYKVQDISEGPDGFPRILVLVFPTGELPGKTDLEYRWYRMTSPGNWTGVTLLTGVSTMPSPNSLGPGGCIDGQTFNHVYLTVDGGNGFKAIRKYSVNESTGALTLLENVSPVNDTRDHYRPKSPIGYNGDCQCYWYSINTYVDYNNFDTDMWIRGTTAIADEVAGVSSYLSTTTNYANRFTVPPATPYKNVAELFLRELTNGNALVPSGVLSKFDLLKLLWMDTRQCLLLDVLNAAYDFTEAGAGTWTAGKGYGSSALGDYLQGPNFATLTKFTLNNNSIVGFARNAAGLVGGLASNDILVQMSGGSGAAGRNNTPVGTSSASVKSNSTCYGVALVRPSSGTVNYYRDGRANTSGAISSSAIPTDARVFFRSAGGFGQIVAAGAAITLPEYALIHAAAYRAARRIGAL